MDYSCLRIVWAMVVQHMLFSSLHWEHFLSPTSGLGVQALLGSHPGAGLALPGVPSIPCNRQVG